ASHDSLLVKTPDDSVQFTTAHWNVQGIIGKTDELISLCVTHNIDIIGICEHWVVNYNLSDINIPGYKLASVFQRPCGSRGGTAIFTKATIEVDDLAYLVELSIPSICEVAAIFVKHSHLSGATATVVWGNDSHANKLLILQKRAIRKLKSRVMQNCFREAWIFDHTSLYILHITLYCQFNFELSRDFHPYETRRRDNL
ncbi:hypothetical protein J6590_069688, partial [Homalodisca vitripennis]